MDQSRQSKFNSGSSIQIDPGLYTWRGNGIVLIGHIENDQFVLARGWIEHDRLAHVRRWKFGTASQIAGQVRRLVMEASDDRVLAEEERLVSLNCLSTATPH